MDKDWNSISCSSFWQKFISLLLFVSISLGVCVCVYVCASPAIYEDCGEAVNKLTYLHLNVSTGQWIYLDRIVWQSEPCIWFKLSHFQLHPNEPTGSFAWFRQSVPVGFCIRISNTLSQLTNKLPVKPHILSILFKFGLLRPGLNSDICHPYNFQFTRFINEFFAS